MSFSLGGSKQKSSQTSSQTSSYTPSSEFLGMVQPGLNTALGLIGSYSPTSAESVSSYLNPYMDTVSQGIRRQADIAANNADAQAAAAGAFGGSGWGLLRGETERAYADAEANARANAYNTALQTAVGENQASQAYDLNALQSYLSGLGLLGNWGTTTGSSSGTTRGSNIGFNAGFKYGG